MSGRAIAIAATVWAALATGTAAVLGRLFAAGRGTCACGCPGEDHTGLHAACGYCGPVICSQWRPIHGRRP